MKTFGLLMALLISAAPAFRAADGATYQTDRGTVGFLHYRLISGGEFYYPDKAARQKLSGSGFFLMRLRPDGVVESVTIKSSTRHAELDEHVLRVLKAYRFRPGTKQPILWLVSFAPPDIVIVKATLIKEENTPAKKK
jgi:TonB family protein